MSDEQKSYFEKRYREMDTDELIDIHRKGNLLEDAAEALGRVLAERGISTEQREAIAAELAASSDDGQFGQLASLGDRFAAQLLDGLIAVAIAIGIYSVSHVASLSGESRIIGAMLAWLAYTLFSDGFNGGQSLGKKMIKIAVVGSRDRKPCGYWRSLARNLPLVFLGVIDWIFILGKARKRLGDHIANTEVIKAPQ